MKKIVFLFSGQGSQYRGMGRELYENNSIFKQSLDASDDIVKADLDMSLLDALYKDQSPEFDNLLITHPAIVAVEIALYAVLEHAGVKADYVSGSSLGEYASACAAGVWSATTAVKTAVEQAQSIVESGVDGGMLAVLGHSRGALADSYLQCNLHVASDNFDGHFTLSGSRQDLDEYQQVLIRKDIQFFRLPVNAPFHSPLIAEGLNAFNRYEDKNYLSAPLIPFVSGVTSKQIILLPQNYFSSLAIKYTNFVSTVGFLESRGPCLYIDLGPSGTSATFTKYNLSADSQSDVLSIMTPFGNESKHLNTVYSAVA